MSRTRSAGPAIILGGGLTGLTAACVLSRRGHPVRVLEAESFLGGASRTVPFNGFRFDLGGHRFYTKNQPVLDLVNGLLGDELITVPRQSRIYIGGRFVDYPLSFFNALAGLGPVASMSMAASYGIEKLKGVFRAPPENTFEDWVVSRFGRRLYEVYFRPYSEKVWGAPCDKLGADFAAQRIKGMSFREAVRSMLLPKRNAPTTLASRFVYPKLGFGRIPERMAEVLPAGALSLSSPVVRVEHDGRRVIALVSRQRAADSRYEPGDVISTIPISDLVRLLAPAAPAEVLEAAAGLRYRDMIVAFLTLAREQVTPDHWIYFSGDDVFFGRMHEPKNWSPAMAPDGKTGLVVETFCFETDPVWSEEDDSILRRITVRLSELRLIQEAQYLGGCVVRLRKAYPLYINNYRERMKVVLDYLRPLSNLQSAGRNGLFKYTSGDWYIETGMKAAENVLGASHDLQLVGSAMEYAES
jgi:protoporphyrinogen oxidase